MHAAFDLEHLADALVADQRLRDRVGHLRQVFHRLVHLAEVQHKDHEHAGADLAAQGEAGAVPEHEAGADGDDDIDHRRQPCLHAAGLERGVHTRQAVGLEPVLFVVFTGKGLHHADGTQDLGYAGEQGAFLLAHRARGRLDLPREHVDNPEEDRGDRERNQRESPVDPQHDADHADQRQDIDEDAEKGGVDEVLNRTDVIDHPRDEVAAVRLAVIGERQPLNVVVQREPQIVRHPLADVGGEVLLGVGADGPHNRDEHHRGDGEVEHRVFVLRKDACADAHQPVWQRLRLHEVVDDDLDGPRLEHIGQGFAQNGDERKRQRLPVRTKQIADVEML